MPNQYNMQNMLFIFYAGLHTLGDRSSAVCCDSLKKFCCVPGWLSGWCMFCFPWWVCLIRVIKDDGFVLYHAQNVQVWITKIMHKLSLTITLFYFRNIYNGVIYQFISFGCFVHTGCISSFHNVVHLFKIF